MKEKEKKERDKKETEDLKRFKRVRIAEYKKETLIKKLGGRKKEKGETEKKLIAERKKNWRTYREKDSVTEEEKRAK